jgi:hypothetical protein
MMDGYDDIRGCSERTSLGVGTIRDYLKGPNPIPHFKLKGKILIRRSEFDDWLEQYRVAGDDLDALVDDVVKSMKSDA